MTSIELRWPTEPSEGLYAGLHRVAAAVAAGGGAVGWLTPPGAQESRGWVDSILALVEEGDAALCVALVDGTVQATGHWRRNPAAVFRHRASVNKVMVHPDARGSGLGRAVTAALVDDAAGAGIETLELAVRGNNHLAIAIYEDLGFERWGLLPNAIEVGTLRFDEVVMYRKLARPDGVVWWGSEAGGPGSSPAPA